MISQRRHLMPVFAAMLLPVSASADQSVSPEQIPGTTLIDAAALIELATTTPDLRIIDSRIHSDRHHGYIEGSVNLPDIETTCNSLAQHIDSLQTPTAFYCNGPKCGRSAKAVKVALGCGYDNLYWYRGGMEAWMAEGFPIVKD